MNKRINNFNLVEVILAMGIVVVCITSIMGMFAAGMQTSKSAVTQAYGNMVIEQIAGLVETNTVVFSDISATKPANDDRKPIKNHQTQTKYDRNDVKYTRKYI